MSKVYFAYGRFNPPTIGHSILFDEAAKHNHVIAVSRTYDRKKNPLNGEKKMHYLRDMWPNVNFVLATKECRDFMAFIKHLNHSYDNIVMLCGEDRKEEYELAVNRYNGIDYNYKSIEVRSIGNRSSEGSLTESVSSTLIRNAVINDDYDLYHKYYSQLCSKNTIFRLWEDLRTTLVGEKA